MNTSYRFSLTLFSTDCDFITRAVASGVEEILVDWEYIGKIERQLNADTQVNRATVADLQRVRSCTEATVLCRINVVGPWTANEIEQAIESGVDEIMLPMVRTPAEVEAVLTQVRYRCGVGILVETKDALGCLADLASLPLSRVYVGLNDLSIERGTPSIFTALADGTVEHIRAFFDVPFGFGGLTLPDLGNPIPCRLLIGEMVRLNSRFSFLRRSFLNDIQGRDLTVEIPRIRGALIDAQHRSMDFVQRDKDELAQSNVFTLTGENC